MAIHACGYAVMAQVLLAALAALPAPSIAATSFVDIGTGAPPVAVGDTTVTLDDYGPATQTDEDPTPGRRSRRELLPHLPLQRGELQTLWNLYLSSVNNNVGFTGNVADCTAGTIDAQFRQATVLRLNLFRLMLGLQPVSENADTAQHNACQESSVMMARNKQLSHYPPPNWDCFTYPGANASAASNLILGATSAPPGTRDSFVGPKSIDDFFDDQGANNAAVGHRRWFIYPGLRTVSVGAAIWQDAGLYYEASAIWVGQGNFEAPSSSMRKWVAWPQGYFPASLLPASRRWSFTFRDADFTNAQVTVTDTSASTQLSVVIEHRGLPGGLPESTLVWLLTINPDVTSSDAMYHVEVAGFTVHGEPQNVAYDVIVADPTRDDPAAPCEDDDGEFGLCVDGKRLRWVVRAEIIDGICDLERFVEEESCDLDPLNCETLELYNRSGFNSIINGVYSESGTFNGRPLYTQPNDVLMFWNAGSAQWQIAPATSGGFFARLREDVPTPLVATVPWVVYNGAADGFQPDSAVATRCLFEKTTTTTITTTTTTTITATPATSTFIAPTSATKRCRNCRPEAAWQWPPAQSSKHLDTTGTGTDGATAATSRGSQTSSQQQLGACITPVPWRIVFGRDGSHAAAAFSRHWCGTQIP
eukprot:m.205147 g.205147  ORF g.205147 m.205147 type:complete len:646 (-) comp18481_c1_seq3:898-2835(-)